MGEKNGKRGEIPATTTTTKNVCWNKRCWWVKCENEEKTKWNSIKNKWSEKITSIRRENTKFPRKMCKMSSNFDGLLNSISRYLITTWHLRVIYYFRHSVPKLQVQQKCQHLLLDCRYRSLLTNLLIALNLTLSFFRLVYFFHFLCAAFVVGGVDIIRLLLARHT